MPSIAFLRLPGNTDLPLPSYATAGAAGFDLRAAASLSLAPGQFAMVPTGFAMAIPAGYEMQVRPRSGLAAKHGVTVLNSPGTVDSDYRGEVAVIMINHGDSNFDINLGDRIAQGVIAAVVQMPFHEADSLDTTERGSGGFGSTGKN